MSRSTAYSDPLFVGKFIAFAGGMDFTGYIHLCFNTDLLRAHVIPRVSLCGPSSTNTLHLPHITIPTLTRPGQIHLYVPPLPHNPRSDHVQTDQQRRPHQSAYHNSRDLFREKRLPALDLKHIRRSNRMLRGRVGGRCVAGLGSEVEWDAFEVDLVGSSRG
jgi:hypothetical protein